MPKVEIAHDVYAALQRRAIPFEDDVNDVLRRLLRDDRSSNGHGPARLDGSVHAVRAIAPVAAATTDNGYRAVDEDANDSGNVIVRQTSSGRRSPPAEHLANRGARDTEIEWSCLRRSRGLSRRRAAAPESDDRLRPRSVAGRHDAVAVPMPQRAHPTPTRGSHRTRSETTSTELGPTT